MRSRPHPRCSASRAACWERVREGARALGETLGASFQSTSATPLNQPLGPHRRFDWLDMDLEQVKAVKNALGGTVNDVVLATVAGALRRFFELRRVDPDQLHIRANVPVSVRSRDERGTLGNRIALLMADLPVSEPGAVRAAAEGARDHGEPEGIASGPRRRGAAAVSEWTSATLLSLAVRGAMRGRPYNLVVTNVPGPQVPLYLLGGRMLSCFPVVNLLTEQALGVALFSYAGTLHWGFTADWELVPDLHEFVRAIEASFAELAEEAECPERRADPRRARLPGSAAGRVSAGIPSGKRHPPDRALASRGRPASATAGT